MASQPPKRIVGPIIGVVAALVMAALILHLVTARDGLSLVAVIWVALVVLLPLLLINFGMSVYYARRNVAGSTYLWMWGPPFSVLLVVAAVHVFNEARKSGFEASHPDMSEIHVNLSGRDVWLDPERLSGSSNERAQLPAAEPATFAAITRYARAQGGPHRMKDYEGARVASTYNEMRVFYGLPAQATAAQVPLVKTAPYPDVSAVANKMTFGRGVEAYVLTHLYYYYSDRVEVVPALRLAGSQSMDLQGIDLPLAEFHIANLAGYPIARLEIDGQAVHLGEQAFAPEKESHCNARNFEAHVFSRLPSPLKVRWQYAQADPPWQEAMVNVPPFKSASGPSGRVRSTSVTLYFQDDRSVLAERSQFIEVTDRERALRTTGLIGALRRPAPCGTAPDRYDDSVKIIRD